MIILPIKFVEKNSLQCVSVVLYTNGLTTPVLYTNGLPTPRPGTDHPRAHGVASTSGATVWVRVVGPAVVGMVVDRRRRDHDDPRLRHRRRWRRRRRHRHGDTPKRAPVAHWVRPRVDPGHVEVVPESFAGHFRISFWWFRFKRSVFCCYHRTVGCSWCRSSFMIWVCVAGACLLWTVSQSWTVAVSAVAQ